MEPELQNGTGESQPSFVFCTQCGNLCNAQESFCIGCGSALNVAEKPSAESKPSDNNFQQNNNTDPNRAPSYQTSYKLSDVYLEDEDAYIQANIEYYKRKFAQMNQNGSKVSWNWLAFLFTPYWLIYRKMYAFGFGYLIFNAILSYGGYYLMLKTLSPAYLIVSSLIIFCIWLTLSLMGNYIYKSRIERLVNEGQKLDEPYKTKHIEKNGGVSLAVLIITIVVFSALSQVIVNLVFKPIIYQTFS